MEVEGKFPTIYTFTVNNVNFRRIEKFWKYYLYNLGKSHLINHKTKRTKCGKKKGFGIRISMHGYKGQNANCKQCLKMIRK